MPTIAEEIATRFENDGSIFENEAGEKIAEVCMEESDQLQAEKQGEALIWVFDDNSAIVEINGVWDVRADGCTAHCWAGAGCSCAKCVVVKDRFGDVHAKTISEGTTALDEAIDLVERLGLNDQEENEFDYGVVATDDPGAARLMWSQRTDESEFTLPGTED